VSFREKPVAAAPSSGAHFFSCLWLKANAPAAALVPLRDKGNFAGCLDASSGLSCLMPSFYRNLGGVQKALLALSAAVLLFLILALTLPWKIWIAERLQTMLEARGLAQVRLTLSSIGFTRATLKNISIGEENPLMLEDVEVSYAPHDLFRGRLHTLTLRGLTVQMRQQEGKWVVHGLQAKEKMTRGLSIPMPRELQELPFDSLVLSDAWMDISAEAWQLQLPFELIWRKSNSAGFSGKIGEMRFKSAAAEVEAAGGAVQLSPAKAEAWSGQWELGEVRIVTSAAAPPSLKGEGFLQAEAGAVSLSGNLQSPDKSWLARFSLLRQEDPQAASFTLQEAVMPWKGGRLRTRNAVFPLMDRKEIKLILQVERVSLNELMQLLTGKRVSATGTVSGTLPLTWRAGGNLSFGRGDLRADSDGTITMPPEAIPGDNEQVALTREILKNFHYDLLSISPQGGDDRFDLLVRLEGKNPDVYAGKPVKLNISLSGDVLEYIKQNMQILTNPESILKPDRK
jgi:hypothetical protein